MNSRERALAILLIFVVVFGGGGFFGYQFVYSPWKLRKDRLETLKKDTETKRGRLDEIERERGKLARWRGLSLPADPDVAGREYEKYLTELLSRHKITNGREIIPRKADNKTSPTVGPNKEPIYTRLQYNVHAYATEDNLVAMLKDFYTTGLMHQIRSLSIQRQMTTTTQASQDELDVRMTVETLIVGGADKRSFLLPNFDRRLMALDLVSGVFKSSPTVLWASVSPGLASPGLLAEPGRDYAAIARKNIFLGQPPKVYSEEDGTPEWMAPRFVHLTDITSTSVRTEAVVFDVLHNHKEKLREFSDAYKTFSFVKDGQLRSVVDGVVVKIEDRSLIYRAEIAAGGESGRVPISRPSKADREKLVADGIIKTADADDVLRVEQTYWETLLRILIVRKSYSVKDGFIIQLERDQDEPVADTEQSYSVEVLRGTILGHDGQYVYIHPEERYYSLHVGESLEESLKKPLPREKVKELKAEVAAR